MSENLIACKDANQFSLSELVWEPGQELGENLRTTQHCLDFSLVPAPYLPHF